MLFIKEIKPLKIVDITVDKFPLVIITDTHTNLVKVRAIRETYPNSQLICLGDITFLFEKFSPANSNSINYFIDNNIPCLKGNHEEAIEYDNLYNISPEERNWISELPIGFRLILPNNTEYLCFHNKPKDLWSFYDGWSEREYLDTYPITDKTQAVLIGHHHRSWIKEFPNSPNLIFIGRVSKDGDFALLNENSIEFKKA